MGSGKMVDGIRECQGNWRRGGGESGGKKLPWAGCFETFWCWSFGTDRPPKLMIQLLPSQSFLARASESRLRVKRAQELLHEPQQVGPLPPRPAAEREGLWRFGGEPVPPGLGNLPGIGSHR
jgi:hypothetical protein